MRVVRRRLTPGETDYELLWSSISLGGLAVAAGWFLLGLPWPRCAFHDLTGLPCLTCGMTRSGIQFFRGNFLSALQWNPLVFAALCGLSIFNVYALFVLVMRAPRLRLVFESRIEKRFVRILAIV